jgi:hypothetical protein
VVWYGSCASELCDLRRCFDAFEVEKNGPFFACLPGHVQNGTLGEYVADFNNLAGALRDARLHEAAQLDAVLSLQDSRVLRLEALQAEVMPHIANYPEAKALFELNVQRGATPKLWIDLISAVVMEPDPQTYRLLQDQNGARETQFESRDINDMTAFVVKYLAHRMLAHSRIEAKVKSQSQSVPEGYTVWEMAYVWFTGCLFGGLSLLLAAMLLGKLHFSL